MLAINTKNQTLVSRLFAAERKYHAAIDANARAMDSICCDDAAFYRLETKHELQESKLFDAYLKYWEQLPKTEQRNYAAQYKSQFGYTTLGA
jgi:hypothetical protein